MSDITFRFVAIGQSDVRAAFKQTRDDAVEMAKAIRALDAAQAQRSRSGGGRAASVGANRDEQRAIKSVGDAAITSFRNDKRRTEQAGKASDEECPDCGAEMVTVCSGLENIAHDLNRTVAVPRELVEQLAEMVF